MTSINKWNSLYDRKFEWIDISSTHPFAEETQQRNANAGDDNAVAHETLNSLTEQLDTIISSEVSRLQFENVHYETYISQTPVVESMQQIIHSIGEITQDAEFSKRLSAEIQRELTTRALAGPRPRYNLDTETYHEFLRNGAIAMNFSNKINREFQELLSPDIEELRNSSGEWLEVGYDREKRYTQDNHPRLYELINKVYEEAGAINIASTYMGCEMTLDGVTMCLSRSTDQHWQMTCADQPTKKLENLHFDPKQGMIKSIHYLKKVSLDDGPFKYIHKSHRWQDNYLRRLAAKANGVTNYMKDASERERFLRLPKALQNCAIIGSLIPDDSPLSEKLLASEHPYTSSEVDAILFDPGGLHRGGIVEEGGERVNLQIMFRLQ